MMSFQYKMEHVAVPHHIITIRTKWRNLPVILDGFRNIPLDIRRAHITDDSSTFYLKEASSKLTIKDVQTQLAVVMKMRDQFEEVGFGHRSSRMKLPMDTQIMLYNMPTDNYTTMEFVCNDRIGLLCDLLLFLDPLSVEIKESFITTVGGAAHNILHLQKNGKELSENDMLYIRNVFEHEAKERFDNIQSHLY